MQRHGCGDRMRSLLDGSSGACSDLTRIRASDTEFTEITVDFRDFITSNPPQEAEAKVGEICREGGEESAWPGAPQRGKHCLDDCGGASAQ